MRVLAFDIGIKNLAWCCADKDASGTTIQGWANENLITGGTAEQDAEKNQCAHCTHKGMYTGGDKLYCVRHCPPLTPALRDLSGGLLKKLPSLAALKAISTRAGAEKADLKNKVTVLAFLQKRFCFPKAAATAVKKVELEALHDGIRKVASANAELFGSCDEILLENQPAYKNPVMKSVQMMLFATLRDVLIGRGKCPRVRLVHAGRKTAGATKGDEGYVERKHASEARVEDGFTKHVIRSTVHTLAWFRAQSKKSDLADCLCMVMDAS